MTTINRTPPISRILLAVDIPDTSNPEFRCSMSLAPFGPISQGPEVGDPGDLKPWPGGSQLRVDAVGFVAARPDRAERHPDRSDPGDERDPGPEPGGSERRRPGDREARSEDDQDGGDAER